MLERDWWDFGFALQDAFPQAWYYRELDGWNRPEDIWQMPIPPDLSHHAHLLDTSVRPGDSIKMVFDANWKPQYKKKYGRYGMSEDQWCWDWPDPPQPSARLKLGGNIYDTPVPHPSVGDITFHGQNKNKEHMALAGRLFRILSKFTTNKKNLVRVRVPSMEVTVPLGSKGNFAPDWCGHHAIEWARQEPNRVLCYVRAGFGIRPTADVKPFAPPPKPKAKASRKKP
ncbi:MAG: hypothetical protein OJJ21_21270 [Ferrovibrio sp.]|uniref:hypothetical protein n=1 Tax=Ferrovibrio sp. TaxID=1917215 RepID=UPI0026059134|nr:hypothetical protein [Ferrovibrio sp.]MCW0236142.1 hypothetical protein [Ferrovibrio sp.]